MTDRIELLAPDRPAAMSGDAVGHLLAGPVRPTDRGDRGHRIDGVLVGTLVALRESHEPLVTYPNQAETVALTARTTVDLRAEDIGHDVTLMFEDGDPLKPIVTGYIRVTGSSPTERPRVEIEADGRRVTVTAKEQLVLKCGDASITLTAAGKILLRGAYLSSHSSGVNRIKGGSVEIN